MRLRLILLAIALVGLCGRAQAQTPAVQLDTTQCTAGAVPVWITAPNGSGGQWYCSSSTAASHLANPPGGGMSPSGVNATAGALQSLATNAGTAPLAIGGALRVNGAPAGVAPLAVKNSGGNSVGLYVESESTSVGSVYLTTRQLLQSATGSNGNFWESQTWSQRTGGYVAAADINPGFCDVALEYGDIDFAINVQNGNNGANRAIAVTACPLGVPSFLPDLDNSWALGSSSARFANIYGVVNSISGDPASVWQNDLSGAATISIANSASAAIPAGSGMIVITDEVFGGTAIYTCGGGFCNLVGGQGEWVASSTTPAGNKASIAWNGSTAYRIYNNLGSTSVMHVALTRTRAQN